MGQGVSRDNYLKSIDTLQKEKLSEDSELWNIILTVPPEDDSIFDTIRNLKITRPDNLAIFINKLVNQLVKVKGSNREKNTTNDYAQTNISLTYLTRILPILFETLGEDVKNDFIEKVFWLNEVPEVLNINPPLQQQQDQQQDQQLPIPITTTPEIVNKSEQVSNEQQQQTISSENKTEEAVENKNNIEDDNGKEPISQPINVETTSTDIELTPEEKNMIKEDIKQKDGEGSSSSPIQQQQKQENSPKNINSIDTIPLAVKLMESLLELLFLPGYTVDLALGLKNPRIDHPDSLPLNFAWLAGFGIENVQTYQSKIFWQNRLAVLQCLLTCISEPLYVTQDQVSLYKSKWFNWLTEEQEYYTEVLFYSLINSFSTYDPIGWGVPYNHIMFSDDHEASAKLSIQVLNVLLSYDPSSPSATTTGNSPNSTINEPHLHYNSASNNQAAQTPISSNRFIRLLRSQKRQRDFKFFFQSFERIINLPILANHTKLPHSTKRIEIHQDIFITFWRFLTLNQDFLKYVVGSESSPSFISPLMQYMDEGRKNQTTHGIIQIGTFLLLVLSGERDFAISMNKTFVGKVYIDIPNQVQTYADFFINVMYRLLVDTAEKLESIFECILTVLSNLSPYMKNLSMVTCVKLMKLFEFLSAPRFLFQASHNHRFVGLLLESFNHILQYQYESNTRLVYAILRCQNQFSKLAYLKITPYTPKVNNLPQPSPNSNPKEALDKLNQLKISDTNSSNNTITDEQQNEVIKDQSSTSIENPITSQDTTTTKDNFESNNTSTTTTTTTSSSPKDQSTVGPSKNLNQFHPTDEWLQDIKRHLPLDNILRVITSLSPCIQNLCTNSGNDEQKIMEYLKMSTIVGLLHSSNTIITRKYHQNSVIRSWFIAYMWCIIYLENHSPPLFLKTNIKLFQIKK